MVVLESWSHFFGKKASKDIGFSLGTHLLLLLCIGMLTTENGIVEVRYFYVEVTQMSN